MFCAGENLCSHFFHDFLVWQIGGHFKVLPSNTIEASEDRISAFIMFCLAEVDDIGLEVPVSIRAIPTPNSAFYGLETVMTPSILQTLPFSC